MYSCRIAVFLTMFCFPAIGQLLPEYIQKEQSKVLQTKNDAALVVAKQHLQKKNYTEALILFKQLAEQGSAEAQAQLGVMYEHGEGTKADAKAAVKWYSLASAQDLAWAQINLGLAYANGRGIAKDDSEATKLFRKAALAGNMKAQEMFATMYDEGRAPPQEGLTAAQWLNPSNLRYITDLYRDFSAKLHFESPEAENIVSSFDIRCQSIMDSRYLPLANLLVARLPSQNDDGIETNTYVIEQGGDVRIIDTFKTAQGETFEKVIFEINEVGELMPKGSITADAISNACFRSYGPIWLLEE